jgi:exodeoxyribonuclease III
MRAVFWNIENVVSRLAELPGVLDHLGKPDVLCLQELRVRQSDAVTVGSLERALPGYRAHYSLPRDARNVTFRGGRMYGVATFVRGRWQGEVPSWDTEGRIVVVRKKALAIVNVYAVNGTAKPYWDAEGRVAGDRHELKRRFQAQVLDLGSRLAEEGSVIMGGDWNVSRTKLDTYPRLRTEEPHALARAQFNERLSSAGFVDIWRERHPTERGYTWYNRRARGLDAARVDYILVSDDLVPKVESAQILERHSWSDHAPVSVELRGR